MNTDESQTYFNQQSNNLSYRPYSTSIYMLSNYDKRNYKIGVNWINTEKEYLFSESAAYIMSPFWRFIGLFVTYLLHINLRSSHSQVVSNIRFIFGTEQLLKRTLLPIACSLFLSLGGFRFFKFYFCIFFFWYMYFNPVVRALCFNIWFHLKGPTIFLSHKSNLKLLQFPNKFADLHLCFFFLSLLNSIIYIH